MRRQRCPPMRHVLAALATLPLILATAAVSAQDLAGDRAIGEVSFSDDTMQLRYRDAGRNMDVGEGGRASVALFLSEDRDIVLFGDVLFPAGLGSDVFQLTFGPRVYAA